MKSHFKRHSVHVVLNIENVIIFVSEKVCVGLIESLRYTSLSLYAGLGTKSCPQLEFSRIRNLVIADFQLPDRVSLTKLQV